MAFVEYFTFNPFQENTYLIYDETGECVIIDPGCHNNYEELMLNNFIKEKNLKPVRLLNTHCHIDHVLGNAYVSAKYSLELGIHKSDKVMLDAVLERSAMWGVEYNPSPEPSYYLQHQDLVQFGNTQLEVRFVPGHAPGHVVFVCHQDKFVIAGDTLFQGSIGRTDLPFGDFDVLEASIKKEIYTLPDSFEIFPGHGPKTQVGIEKRENPYIRG